MVQSSQVDLEAGLRVIELPKVVVGDDKKLEIEGYAAGAQVSKALAQHFNLPWQVTKALTPETKARVFNEMAEHFPFRAIAHDNTVAALAWSNFTPPPTATIIEQVEKELGLVPLKEHTGVDQFDIFFGSREAFEVVTGDVVYFGFRYAGSLTGNVATSARGSFYRPWCSNGAFTEVSPKNVRWFNKSTPRIDSLLSQARAAMKGNEAMGENIRSMARTPVEDPVMEIQRIATQYRFSGADGALAVASYYEEPNPTLWGLYNAFTRAANTSPAARDLREVANRSAHTYHRCVSCGRDM